MSTSSSFSRADPHGLPFRRKWLEAGLIIAFWTIVAVLMIGSRALDRPDDMPDQSLMLYLTLRAYLWALLTPLVFWLVRRFSIDRSEWLRSLSVHATMALLLSIAIEVLSDIGLYYIVQPRWAQRISFNPLDSLSELDFLYELTIYLSILAAGFARDYFLRYQERRKQAAELQTRLTRARLDALRMQINPHFLFNTLHAISSLVDRDPQGVRRMVVRLSDLLRYTLDESDTQEVPLRKEIEVLDAYLDIQRIRFQGRLEIEQHIAPETHDALVPPLILQPIVENAIKHGIGKLTGIGRITIRAYRQHDTLVLNVADNGPGLPGDDIPLEKGVGLRNTQDRLQGLYGTAADLMLDESEAGGVLATITLPFHTEDTSVTTAASA